MKPETMEIAGKERSLDEVIEGIIVLGGAIEENKEKFRHVWRTWLPPETSLEETNNGFGRIAYIPLVCMRKCYPAYEEFSGKVRDIPYFILILNQAREKRPKSKDEKQEEDKSHCKLCKNILEKKMILSEIDDYFVTPNGYPYHMNASLLIYKGTDRKQGDIRTEDIATWMKASILLDQYIFYNTMEAGASISEHQHVQMVDPQIIKIDNEIIPYPILNLAFVGREPVGEREDVFRLKNYPVDALIFTGSDAPDKVAFAAHTLQREGRAFNILVNRDEVFVIGRNKERETSICIRRKVGGYEISGVALLGDIEEVFGRIYGVDIFNNMKHNVFAKNIRGASIPLDWLEKKY